MFAPEKICVKHLRCNVTFLADLDATLNGSAHEVEEDRGKWGNKFEFVLASVGLTVGLGNIWRFSALAYENGGSAFLIPYIVLIILFGLPTMFLEMAIGQYTSSGPSMVFKHYMPALQGMCCRVSVLAKIQTILYLFFSFFDGILLWESCSNEWNDICKPKEKVCTSGNLVWSPTTTRLAFKFIFGNVCFQRELLFRNVITRRSQGIEYIGGINWSPFLTLMAVWGLVFLVLIKGQKYLGKVAYVRFTSTSPYLIIAMLFFRAITLEGSGEGLYYYMGKPDFSKLTEHQTWSAALVQICFSINIGYGSVIMLASYNKRNNNCFADAWIVVAADLLMSVFGGAAVFATLGYLSHELQVPIDEVVSSGHSLAFVAYPEAISKMPYQSVWSALFYSMLFLLGFSSEIAFTETFCTSIYDQWPSTRSYKWLVSLSCCVVFFACGIILTTEVSLLLNSARDCSS
ncbi:unnamed protein product [Angiostrongylus costaricensis]|uniref:Transporter n=1 Tax=Angiostrongylus costaricensis TaxID=334426 RepID=A0A0R3PSD9_ANGCS|nr:unnamed protein product [Angiostrongylus costaricensis]